MQVFSPLKMFSLAIIVMSVAATSSFAQKKVPVTVYYESLCPDSITFYTTQLYPAWNSTLQPFMELMLIPFGKATYTHVGDNYTFSCHHGEKECLGNKVQACALNKIPDMDVQVKYINCLMGMSKKSPDQEYPTKSCAADVKIAGDLLDKIENCVNSNEANEYLAALGNMTMKFQNPLSSVPSVVFNKRMDDKDKDARTDFKGVLCSYIKDGKPSECGKSGAGSAVSSPLAAGLVTALIAFIITNY